MLQNQVKDILKFGSFMVSRPTSKGSTMAGHDGGLGYLLNWIFSEVMTKFNYSISLQSYTGMTMKRMSTVTTMRLKEREVV